MSRGKKLSVPAPAGDSAGTIRRVPGSAKLSWVNPYLDATDKQWLRDNQHAAVEYIGALVDTLGMSFTFSCKFEDRSGRYLASLVCSDAEHPAASCAISVRGATAIDSAYALAYLVLFKSETPWWVGAGGSDSDPWG